MKIRRGNRSMKARAHSPGYSRPYPVCRKGLSDHRRPLTHPRRESQVTQAPKSPPKEDVLMISKWVVLNKYRMSWTIWLRHYLTTSLQGPAWHWSIQPKYIGHSKWWKCWPRPVCILRRCDPFPASWTCTCTNHTQRWVQHSSSWNRLLQAVCGSKWHRLFVSVWFLVYFAGYPDLKNSDVRPYNAGHEAYYPTSQYRVVGSNQAALRNGTFHDRTQALSEYMPQIPLLGHPTAMGTSSNEHRMTYDVASLGAGGEQYHQNDSQDAYTSSGCQQYGTADHERGHQDPHSNYYGW